MTRVGAYCFDLRVAAWTLLAATAVLLFAPSVLQAAALMVVGTCPVTTVASVCKIARLHPCGEREEDWERSRPIERDAEETPSQGPYAGLVAGMFGRRK